MPWFRIREGLLITETDVADQLGCELDHRPGESEELLRKESAAVGRFRSDGILYIDDNYTNIIQRAKNCTFLEEISMEEAGGFYIRGR